MGRDNDDSLRYENAEREGQDGQEGELQTRES